MIPLFVVSLIDRAAKLFGYQVVCRATVGRFGVDRIYVHKPGEMLTTELRG